MKINFTFFIMLYLSVITFTNDMLIYFFKINYVLGLVIANVVCLLITFILLKKKRIQVANNFEMHDLIFIFLFMCVSLLMIVCPDYLPDTITYHYYKQANFFVDKIDYDFLAGAGNVNDYSFPLAERMNYIFRFFLGIRLGRVLSFFSIIVLYYEVKKIINFLSPNINKFVKFFCAIFPISLPIVSKILGSYYIDIYGTIFLLEAFYISLKEKSIFEEKDKLYYWFLVSGILVGFKISNLVILVPIGFNIIYNNCKNFNKLKIADYLICFIVFFLPFFIYGLNNFLTVGNFFYPFLGGKKFYEGNDWRDHTFGADNVFMSLVWPIVVTIYPLKGHNEATFYEFIWAFGYVFLIINILIKLIKKDTKKDLFRSEIITLAFSLLWANFMMGYCRYAIIIPILYVINIVSNLKVYIDKNVFYKLYGSMQILSLVVIFIFSLKFVGVIQFKQHYITSFNSEVKKCFKDKDYTIHIDGAWGTINLMGGLVSLVREEGTPIYNLGDIDIKDSDFFYNKYLDKVRGKDIYILTTKYNRDEEDTLNAIKENNFEIVEKIAEYSWEDIPYIQYLDTWTLYKIKYVEKN